MNKDDYYKRYLEILELRKENMSFGKIAKIYNISRARVEQIIKDGVSPMQGKGKYKNDNTNAVMKYYYKNKEKILTKMKSKIFKKYGITKEEYMFLVEKQGCKCAICGRERKLVIDHDHETGKVRSLLCQSCNVGIGLLQDSPSLLEIAKQYITGHKKH